MAVMEKFQEKPIEPRRGVSTSSKSSTLSNRGDEELRIGAIGAGIQDEALSTTTTREAGNGPIQKTLSLVRTKDSWRDVEPPPDGGFVAWSQACLAHMVIFNTWGYINSFGVFQTYYTTALNHPPSDISWVGSVQVFLLFGIGAFSGRATDAGFFRLVFVLGTVMQLLGVFMTSLSTKYWQLFLAQGLCTGIGNGLVFCPTLSLLPTYFSKNRAVALAIAACGSATGGLVFPAIVERLLPRIGFGWTVRVLGFVMLGTMSLSVAFLKPRLPPRKSGPIVEWAAFKELPYLLFSISMFLAFWGLYFAFYYIGSFGREVIGVTESTSIDLLLIMNGVGVLGRLIPNYLSDQYIGPLNAILPFFFVTSLLIYCWAAVTTTTGLYTFAVIYGLFAAGIQSLFPAVLSSLTTDLKKSGTRMGMVFSVVSFATLTGTPLAGALIQKGYGNYLYAQMFAGSSLALGFLTLLAARVAKAGWKLKVKV